MRTVPLRRRLFVLVAAALLPVAIASGIAIYSLYLQHRARSEQSVLEVARALSTAVDAEIDRTLSILRALASSTALEQEDFDAFRQRVERARQPSWTTVILVDATGRQLINTGIPAGTPLPQLVERESFEQAVRSAAPVIGRLRKGPLGNWGVALRVPVMRDGQVRYVLTAVLSPTTILEILQRTRMPADWVVAVADSAGIRVARTQSPEQSLGTPFSPTLVEMMARGGPEGTGVTHNSEGVPVFTAYTRSPETGWITAVGLPVRGVQVEAVRSFTTFGGGVLLSLGLGILAALLVARSITRPIAQVGEAALMVGRRRPLELPRTEIREIQDVAEALAASERERAQGEAERENLLRSEQQARAAAEGANRAKDEFLAMLGHELRNPLGAIANASALLDHPGLDEARKQDARGIILRQVSHLTRLTDDLLDAGRAVMGKIVLQRRPVDMGAIAAQALGTLRASGRTQRHAIETKLESAWVDADAIRLDQILANLVINAVKYSPAGSTIRVVVRREGPEVVVSVADQGIGIPPELAPRVFDLFVQGDRQLDRSLGGLGIGLTLVRRLAEMHGGSAEVRSEGDGKGSEFIVRLPAIEAPDSSTLVPAQAKPTRALDILIVEDNDDARETLRVLLEMNGHRVHAEPDGERGLETALRVRPTLMLLDVGLPLMDGYELARRIRAADGWETRPTLVAVTGYGQPADRSRALAAGFDLHLAKPVDPQRILDVVASAATST
jgi:signal transduction histidine kinase/ActR/RegA family two-component response regulator